MKLIKINKIILILAFFMPFTATMCSRSANIGKAKEENSIETTTLKSTIENCVSYLRYPTEYSASGFGFTYNFIRDIFMDD